MSGIDRELAENYEAIVKERGISHEHLAVNADKTGDRTLAAHLRARAAQQAPAPAVEVKSAPKDRSAPEQETA